MTDIVAELRPMGRITSLSTLDERFHLSRSRLQTESEAEAHRSELARFIIENGWDGKYKPVTTAVYHEKYVEAMSAEIERLRLSLSEARATGRREGMEAMTDALNDDALTKRAADFLLERDQQTTQDERDEGEREASAFIILQMGAAAIRAAMEKEE